MLINVVKTFRNVALGVLISTTVIIVGCCLFYNHQLSPVSNSTEAIEVEIPNKTSAKGIAVILKEKKLIRDERMFLIYVKLMKVNNMKAGYYDFTPNMGVKKIVKALQNGSKKNPDEIKITFQEGINIRTLATIISENTVNSFDSVMELLKNETYLDELIQKYWFIGDEVKNKKLYYSLEGYLFPDTYYFNNKNVTVKEIFTKMLEQTDKVLSEYKTELTNQNITVHELLTLASVIEKEGKHNDFALISSVFHNRIKINMSLQSCATAYYGLKLEFNELGIANDKVINAQNDYNTYKLNGLPIGPIALPSKEAIKAAIYPANTDYLYFLSDNKGVTYFFKTFSEHQQKQKDLMAAGKWYR